MSTSDQIRRNDNPKESNVSSKVDFGPDAERYRLHLGAHAEELADDGHQHGADDRRQPPGCRAGDGSVDDGADDDVHNARRCRKVPALARPLHDVPERDAADRGADERRQHQQLAVEVARVDHLVDEDVVEGVRVAGDEVDDGYAAAERRVEDALHRDDLADDQRRIPLRTAKVPTRHLCADFRLHRLADAAISDGTSF